MTGQGSPNVCPLALLLRALAVFIGAFLVLGAGPNLCGADEHEMRLRIAWGGGTPRPWHGRIWIESGSLAEPAPLGMEPDVPGSMRLSAGEVRISAGTARQFDGLDLRVQGSAESRLFVELESAPFAGLAEARPRRMEFTLASLIEDPRSMPLDEAQNRLVVRRSPGDKLRVRFDRESLVFRLGERFQFEVAPHLAGLPPDAPLKCLVQVCKARTETELWKNEWEVKTDSHGACPTIGPVAVEIPEAEGAYDVLISLYGKRSATALTRARPLVQRKVQFLALAEKPDVVATADWKTELEIDPANPKWWEKLQALPQLRLWPGASLPPSGEKLKTRRHLGQNMSELAAGGWQAVPLPLARIGEPYILEVEYPSDLRQTLGISLIEPNAAGAVAPLGLDTGVDTAEPRGVGRIEKHRIVFWPRTKAPIALLTNRRRDEPALFGKLRILGGPKNLPVAGLLPNAETERLLLAYFDKPLFPENFGASEGLDPSTNRSLDDWETFLHGGRRLVEYLKYAGYNGAIVSVVCEGSALYPSRLLEPTPKYDSGAFFASGQDPLRKDALEMLFSLFDREGLRLVPAVQFASPLPALETLLAQDQTPPGVALVDRAGKTWPARHGASRGLAPRYNLLDARVQDAMLAVLEELAARSARHPSFGGVALQLGPDTYAQLPGEEWGADAATLARFSRATGISVKAPPGDFPPGPFTGAARSAWLTWRARQLAEFYRHAAEAVAKLRPEATLYLAGADLMTGREMQLTLRPSLSAPADANEALLRIGIDPARLADNPQIVLLKPERLSAAPSFAARALNLASHNLLRGEARFAAGGASGNLFFLEPMPLRLAAFDQTAPFGAKNSLTWLAPAPLPGGAANRARFTAALALADAQIFCDGSWLLPLGQEDALRPLVEAYRSLPAERFHTVAPKLADSRQQPVTIRALSKGDRTFLYLVNDSPWSLSVEVEIEARPDCRLDSLTSRKLPQLSRPAEKARWNVALEPFDLVAAALTDPAARITQWQAAVPAEAKAELEQQLRLLRVRANTLQNSAPLAAPQNGGFEAALDGDPLPGWLRTDAPGVTIAHDDRERNSGEHSLQIASRGPTAWVRSEPLEAPASGRLSVRVWLRVRDPKRQPPLRLAIEGKFGGEPYYRFAQVGAGADVPRLEAKWAPYVFQVEDLPLAGLTDLRVGFDLMGAGEVWVDDVQVFDAWLPDNERDELQKQIALSDADLAAGRIADCRRFLESYWPQFLLAQTPAEPPRLAARPSEPPRPEREPAKPAPSKSWYLERLKLSPPRWFQSEPRSP